MFRCRNQTTFYFVHGGIVRRAAGCDIPVVVWDHCPERVNGRDNGPILRYFSACRSPKKKHPTIRQGVVCVQVFFKPELECQDHVAAEGSLARGVLLVEAESFAIPYPSNFWSEQQVRIVAIVDTGSVVQIVVVAGVVRICIRSVEVGTIKVEILEAISNRYAVVQLVDQVVDVAIRVAFYSASIVPSVEYVGLRNVGQLFGKRCCQDSTVNATPLAAPSISLIKSSQSSCVQERVGVVQFLLEPADVCIAVVLEAAVPTHNVTIIQLGIRVDVVGRERTGMGERLSVVERKLSAVEEIAGRLHYFITDDCVEASDFGTQISHGDFAVQLWYGMTIIAIVPSVVEMPVGDAERLGILGVGTVDVVYASTETEAFTTVRNFFGKEILLPELNTIVVVEVAWIAVGVISYARPTADVKAADWVFH